MANVPVKRVEKAGAGAFLPQIEKLLERIEKRAYDLFAKRGFEIGHDLEDWLTAEREIVNIPAAEMKETDTEFKLEITVPGIPPDKLQVNVLPDSIVVEGEAEEKKEETKENVLFSEFKSRKLFRKFELPAKIDVSKVTANADNGVLRVVAKKAEAEVPRRISVAA